jgi:peptidyl-prolyl cis-trans isomerase B (cyclophilin B)
VKSENGFEYNMTAEDNMVYLFTHFAKHYRDCGIGIRHLVDLWVYKYNNPSLDEEYINKELEKLQLDVFYSNIIKTLGVWFEDAECDDVSDFITQVIFSSGVYGKAENRTKSIAIKERKKGKNVTTFMAFKIFKTVFKGYGKMVVLLDATTAPITVANFVSLVEKGFYDGLTLHRIIGDFMIQGGDPDGNGRGGSDKEIKGEFDSNGWKNDISHKYGVISMARSNDPDSASSQFFICNADASASLDGKYAAFGYVVEGLSVVDDITKGTLEKAKDYYGTDYGYWLYYGNGALDARIQPKIKYIRLLDSWEKK